MKETHRGQRSKGCVLPRDYNHLKTHYLKIQVIKGKETKIVHVYDVLKEFLVTVKEFKQRKRAIFIGFPPKYT